MMETIHAGGNGPMTAPIERVKARILSIRGRRVMLDADLVERRFVKNGVAVESSIW